MQLVKPSYDESVQGFASTLSFILADLRQKKYMAKYQKLEHLEAGWKKAYLLRRHRQGEWISRHPDRALHEKAVSALESSIPTPQEMDDWVEQHLAQNCAQQLDQAIRARRKRHFCAEKSLQARKTVDLTYEAWKSLSDYATTQGETLSQALQSLLAFKAARAQSEGSPPAETRPSTSPSGATES